MGHRICRRDNIRIGGIGYDGTVPVISVSAAEQLKDVQEHVHEVEIQVQRADDGDLLDHLRPLSLIGAEQRTGLLSVVQGHAGEQYQAEGADDTHPGRCLLYTSPSPRD